MKTPKEFIETALGGNMNISTLKLKVWEEMLGDYAKYYHEEKGKIKVVINDTLKQIVIDAHLAGQTVIAGNGEKVYAEKYYNDSFSA